LASGVVAFIGFDVLMELVSSIIALIIAYYAALGYKALMSRVLLYLNLSFSVLGCGLFIDALLTAYAVSVISIAESEALLLLKASTFILYFCEVTAFGLLTYAYVRQRLSASMPMAPMVIALLRGYTPVVEAVIAAILLFIFVQTASNAASSRSKPSIMVSASFLLLCLSHIFFMLTRTWVPSYVVAHTLQLAGFACLLAMLLMVRARR